MLHISASCHAALSACLSVFLSATGDDPGVKWTYVAKGTLYAPLVVADIHPAPGRETLISDAEVRTLRCIDAAGKQLWSYRGGWTKRLTSAAAVSATGRPGHATILIGGSDGKLCCLDGRSGRELWSRPVGAITWGTACWNDLDGDGRDEAIAGTEHAVVVLNVDGTERWAYRHAKGEPPLDIVSPLATCDIDGDGRAEVFAVDRLGPFCLNGDGTLRWRHLGGEGYYGAVVIADADRDGRPELYCHVANDPAIVAFDARSGDVRWNCPTLAEAGSLAVGDLNRDGADEIVAADEHGYVYALDPNGRLIWSFQTAKRAPAEITMGDVDGDGDIEMLVAGWDRFVYCLDSAGQLEWRYRADRRVLGAPTITDVDGDGKTDVLFGGSGHVLRCLTLGGAYDPALIPWPSSGCDASQSSAAFPIRVRPLPSSITETRTLPAWGDFERSKMADDAARYPKGSHVRERQIHQPRGWHADPPNQAGWQLDEKTVRSGKRAVCVSTPMRLVSAPMVIDRTVCGISAIVYGKGRGAEGALLRWAGSGGVLREDRLKHGDEKDGWQRFGLDRALPPRATSWVQLVLITGDGGAWWDDACITAELRSPPKVDVLVNQVGYDVGAPKRFNVQANFKAKTASFWIVRADGCEALSGTLHHAGRVKGRFGHDWGHEYYRGDFSKLDAPGRYRVRVVLDKVADASWPFEIGADLIWRKTARPAYRFFYYQRCGFEVPGYHGACHLDDGLDFEGKHYDLSGGWHDAGDYNTYHNAPYVFGLARAYGIGKAGFDRQDADGNGRADLLDEILWGGDHSRRIISPDGSAFGRITSGYGFWGPPELETDNKPGTGDERPVQPPRNGVDASVHHAAMAKIARYVKDNAPWVEAAERGLRWALKNKKRGVYQFTTAVDLYAATRLKRHADLARELFPKITPDETVLAAVRDFDVLLGEDHSAEIRKTLVAWAEKTLALADNPFGVYTFGPADRPNFFGTKADQDGWRVGTNSHLCRSASLMALAYRYEPKRCYLTFVYDQINWILGNNPFDVSLMEGVGSAFLPTYHNRLIFGGVDRGAVPGSVVNGVTCRGAGMDVPCVDMTGLDLPAFESNECWLPHNTNYLNTLANLRQAGAPK